MHRIALIALLCFATLCSATVRAQGSSVLKNERLAVLEFSEGTGVALQAPDAMADDCRGAVVDATRSLGTLVLTRENMLEVLKATGGVCAEGQCEVETARNLNVAYFITGNVSKIDGRLVLTLKAYETRKGALLASKRAVTSSELELLDQVTPTTRSLMKDAFGAVVAAAEGAKQPDAAPAPKAESPTHEPAKLTAKTPAPAAAAIDAATPTTTTTRPSTSASAVSAPAGSADVSAAVRQKAASGPLKSTLVYGGATLTGLGVAAVGASFLPSVMISQAQGRAAAEGGKAVEEATTWQAWYDSGMVTGLLVGGGIAAVVGAGALVGGLMRGDD